VGGLGYPRHSDDPRPTGSGTWTRLDTLPQYLALTALHRLLASKVITNSRGFESSHLQLTQKYKIPHPHVVPTPAHSLRLQLEEDRTLITKGDTNRSIFLQTTHNVDFKREHVNFMLSSSMSMSGV
jgi:hypothetical protein